MTLIEMIVVLAIIGVSAGAAVLALGAGRTGDGQTEARQLAATLQLAADSAMFGDKAYAVSIAPDGYAVLERGDDTRGWQPATLSGHGGAHALPKGTTLSADSRATLLPLDPDADGQGFALTLTRGDRHWTVTFDGMTARLSAPGPHTAEAQP